MLQFLNEDTGVLKDAVFCFTGKSPKTRIEMQHIAYNAGAKVTRSISGNTTILVVADPNSQSSKVVKAQQLGLDMISPKQFFDMCSFITQSNSGSPISQIHITKPKQTDRSTKQTKHSSIRRIQL